MYYAAFVVSDADTARDMVNDVLARLWEDLIPAQMNIHRHICSRS